MEPLLITLRGEKTKMVIDVAGLTMISGIIFLPPFVYDKAVQQGMDMAGYARREIVPEQTVGPHSPPARLPVGGRDA